MKHNLFERYDLDPRDGPLAITERLRELAEEATDERARADLRAAWEELTMHPARRLREALTAHPETRPAIGAPPPRALPRAEVADLTLRDLVTCPSIARALGASARPATPRVTSLDDDPILRRKTHVR